MNTLARIYYNPYAEEIYAFQVGLYETVSELLNRIGAELTYTDIIDDDHSISYYKLANNIITLRKLDDECYFQIWDAKSGQNLNFGCNDWVVIYQTSNRVEVISDEKEMEMRFVFDSDELSNSELKWKRWEPKSEELPF